VSKKKSARAKRENRLVKSGYVTQKGVFGSKLAEKKSPKKSPKRKSPKKRSKKR